MARERPNLAITLPRNFHYTYANGELPKTPEREIPSEVPTSPQAYYRIRRRSGRHSRPSLMSSDTFRVSTDLFKDPDREIARDVPIPTIEAPEVQESTSTYQSIQQQRPTTPLPQDNGFLSPIGAGGSHDRDAPRTPTHQVMKFDAGWSPTQRKKLGDTIPRPASGFSLVTDSSDDSDLESDDGFSYGTSCTSPESEASEISQTGLKPDVPNMRLRFDPESPVAKRSKHSEASRCTWTPEMDKFIWTIYMKYLQDPTVTPFKTLPGAPPPLGVCHRVAREARRGWTGPKTPSTTSKNEVHMSGTSLRRGGSSDTITAQNSGSLTPTETANPKTVAWPKSGSSTRRRLRALCKRKATITPHYQRLLKSRSPSPFSSSARPSSRTVRMSSSATNAESSFATRDIQMSLTTSTSATMQPNGPLAQLNRQHEIPSSSGDWFNDPSVPWASPPNVPSSDVFRHHDEQMMNSDLPSLGSPFGNNTWGPSRSRINDRPSTARTHSDNIRASAPRLNSPIHIRRYPQSGSHKRRAQSHLEEELSPGGTDLRRHVTEDLFGGRPEHSQRRVRSRGFTTGQALTQGRLSSIYSPTREVGSQTVHGYTTPPPSNAALRSLENPSHAEASRRLGSPFAGISTRPTRTRRHLASSSLPVWDSTSMTSIDQRLDHLNHGN